MAIGAIWDDIWDVSIWDTSIWSQEEVQSSAGYMDGLVQFYPAGTRNVVYVGNDNVCELTDLRNGVTEQAITDATVTLALYDRAGVAVVGPVTMPHVSAGTYRGGIDDGVALMVGTRYRAQIIAQTAYGLRAQFDIPVWALPRVA